MSPEASRKAFFTEMDKLRRGPKRIEPSDVASLARQAGLPPHEALIYIQSFVGPGYQKPGEMLDALSIFISALCKQAKANRVLEYTSVPSLLTARLAEGDGSGKVSYIAPHEDAARPLQILFSEKGVTGVKSITDLKQGAVFDLIVCAPPLGHKPAGDANADVFGGEIVRQLVPALAQGGILCWVTGRGATFNARAKKTLSDLKNDGLDVVATIDVPPGGFPGTTMEGVVVILRREAAGKRLVGTLRDVETAVPLASAILAGPSRKIGPNWEWLDAADQRSFLDLEHARLIQQLKPRGRYATVSLASLLLSPEVEKADRPVASDKETAAFLYVPEYAGSRVTADLNDQTVQTKAVYRLTVDPAKANPQFLARLLNSPFGMQLRGDRASGATIQRVSVKNLLALELPIPDVTTQDRIVRVDGDFRLLQAAFQDMQGALDRDWSGLTDVVEKIDGLQGVLNIERKIADWWRELPYPLATIYRRYRVSKDPKERLETLLHFFEMAAVYLATIGTSHVKAMRKDWSEVLAKWLHPTGAAGIERTDFGFWTVLTGASLKDVSRIASDKELRAAATEIAGPELVEVASEIGRLGKATEVLDVAKRHRNLWIGHGGHMKPTDAARLEAELQQPIRNLYEITAATFRRLQLVRPGTAEGTDTGYKFQIEKLSSSDPTFERETVELVGHVKSHALAFWMRGAKTICRALPFFRLGAPQQPQESSFYVFNRADAEGLRWISYQEAREQAIYAADEELQGIIALGKNTT